MAVARSLEEYRAIQKGRITKLKTVKRRGPIIVAKFMAAQLRAMCPRGEQHRGEMMYPHMYQTIKRAKNSVRLGGFNPNSGFPYVHWVNATPGMDMEKVNLGGKAYSYAQTQHTGVPGFYWIAQTRAREFNRDAMINATRKVISSTF